MDPKKGPNISHGIKRKKKRLKKIVPISSKALTMLSTSYKVGSTGKLVYDRSLADKKQVFLFNLFL